MAAFDEHVTKIEKLHKELRIRMSALTEFAVEAANKLQKAEAALTRAQRKATKQR